MTETQTPEAVTVTHRGARLQLHIADWVHGAADKATRSLHVQDLAGGAGRILGLEKDESGAYAPAVAELVDEHPEVRDLVEGSSTTEPTGTEPKATDEWPHQA